jgi:hypothetical protein
LIAKTGMDVHEGQAGQPAATHGVNPQLSPFAQHRGPHSRKRRCIALA